MPAMSTRFHLAIRRPDDARLLVLADGSMPGFRLDDAPPWPVVTPVVDECQTAFGLEVVALRAAWIDEPMPRATPGSVDRLYEAVWVGGTVPSGARWIALEDLGRRATAMGRAIDAGALEPLTGDRQPWYRPGWLAECTTWIDACLDVAGLRRHGAPRQVRSWGRSALLTVETDRGRVWAKQVPVAFAHEIAVTGLLADVDPGIVPPLIAADPATGRLLMEDVPGPSLAALPLDDPAWPATMARLAEIQRVLASDASAVRLAGVPSGSLDQLEERVPGLLRDDDALRVDRPGGLSEGQVSALRAAEPALLEACRGLASSPVGLSLDHGDLGPDQVIMSAMGPVFLDWSDASRTHPYLAAASFLSDPEIRKATAPALERAYLDGWPADGTVEERASALELARLVHPLYLAALVVDRVLPGLEQPWELERTVPQLLGGLVGRVPAATGSRR
jgi:hypothetical protein